MQTTIQRTHIQKYAFFYLYFFIVAGTALLCAMPSFKQEPTAFHAFWLAGEAAVAAGFFFILYRKDMGAELEHITDHKFGELFIWMVVSSGLFCLVGICQGCHTFVAKNLFFH